MFGFLGELAQRGDLVEDNFRFKKQVAEVHFLKETNIVCKSKGGRNRFL